MKKIIIMVLVVLVTFTAFSQGQRQQEAPGEETATLYFLRYGAEQADAFYRMIELFEAEYPNIRIEGEIVQTDYYAVLQTKLNAGDVPDIFATTGWAHNAAYDRWSADLSDEPWIDLVHESALESVYYDGRITGFPTVYQGYAFMYNKDMFEDAGIQSLPKTLSELEDACIKLENAGYVPFSTGYSEWWVFKHIVSHAMAADYELDPMIPEKLTSGELTFQDLHYTQQVFELIDLTLRYSLPRPIETDFNSQMTDIATGRAAMTHQGIWAERSIMQINPDVNLGFMGAPISEDPSQARLMADIAGCYRLYKDSPNLEAAKTWLNWFITSDYAKTRERDSNQISSIKDALPPDSPLSNSISEYLATEQVYTWPQNQWPQGFEEPFGYLLQAYAAGASSRDEVLDEATRLWVRLARRN